MDSIQKAVAEQFQIQPAQLKEKSNTQQIVYPRQVAMYLVKELTQASLPEIGRAFGGKHHTTVIHSINKIDKQRQNDPDFNRLIHKANRTHSNELILVFHRAAPKTPVKSVNATREAQFLHRSRTRFPQLDDDSNPSNLL